MKILWFEVTKPAGYYTNVEVIGGWQDSLEDILRGKDNIDLYVAFAADSKQERLHKDNVTYIPLFRQLGYLDKLRSLYEKDIN